VPTLVAWGDHDQVVKPSYGQSYASAISGAQFKLIPNCGHYPHIEQPEALVKAIDEFVGSQRTKR
jgi:pimeloyl-ACP methyl ester carboxylesterase